MTTIPGYNTGQDNSYLNNSMDGEKLQLMDVGGYSI